MQLVYNYFRTYDPQTGRYIESDPIGLDGGRNTYSYVENTPVSAIDPFGLVKWRGTVTTGAVVDFIGAAGFRFNLESECKCGSRLKIEGFASAVGAGLSYKLFSATISPQKFYDHEECPRGDIANGGFAIVTAGGSVGIGGSCNKITIGGLFSKFGCGRSSGADLGAALLVGASYVTNVETTSCCSDE